MRLWPIVLLAYAINLSYFVARSSADSLCKNLESFVRGSLAEEGREDPISGPSLARPRNAILMAFRWRADDGPTLNAGR